jgi:hypothetical protein
MKNLIPTIDAIIKYGLQPNLDEVDKEKVLERNLVKIYDLYFDIDFEFDGQDYPEFDRSLHAEVRQNVQLNFTDFGYYRTVIDINDISSLNDDFAIGDAIDDLSDIILDLMEVKWRYENNSEADGLWFFQFIFNSHTQQHILDLLQYLKNKEES